MKWFIFHLHSGFCITEIFCHVTRGQGVESSFFSYVTEETKVSSEAVSEYLESKRKYEEMRMEKLKKGSSREAQTLSLLDRFKSKLSTAISQTPETSDDQELGEDDDKGW
ncbi:spliceosome-associated protein CWC27 homolog isoform X1 [Tachysurus ichikawai]